LLLRVSHAEALNGLLDRLLLIGGVYIAEKRGGCSGSDRVREGLKEVLLGPAQLYEALRQKAGEQGVEGGYP
jgi:hypothetical protein